jgi:hypothetical protein
LVVSSASHDLAVSVRAKVAAESIAGGGAVCVNAADIIKDVNGLIRPHAITVSWEGHGKRGNPAGKVLVTAVNDRKRRAATGEYDAYDPENVVAAELGSENAPWAQIAVGELRRCVDAVAFAADANDSRTMIFDHIMVRLVEDGLQLAATDKSSLATVTSAPEHCEVLRPVSPNLADDLALLRHDVLPKAIGLFEGVSKVQIVSDQTGFLWLRGGSEEGILVNVRTVMPAKEKRQAYPAPAIDKFTKVALPISIMVDRDELVQATTSALARGSRNCTLTITEGATEIPVEFAGSSKPSMVGCDAIVKSLQSPIRLSSHGLLEAAKRITSEKVILAFTDDEKRGILRSPEDQRVCYAFQRSKQIEV